MGLSGAAEQVGGVVFVKFIYKLSQSICEKYIESLSFS